MTVLVPGPRTGTLRLPPSKSHAHRVLIAEFLAGRLASLAPSPLDCDDVAATKRCLQALRTGGPLDVGESGTTRRLLGPLAPALGVKPAWILHGRLAERPQLDYPSLVPGIHRLAGDVSSQFVSGLLFALPLLDGDSEIVLTTPLASRGYVDLTRDVLAAYGVNTMVTPRGFAVPGRQRYLAPEGGPRIEGDWSSAAFGLALNALGSSFHLLGAETLRDDSRQPDRAIVPILAALGEPGDRTVDVDACPDLFPVLAVVAATRSGVTRFTGTRRLRLKECDRSAAMADVLRRFGVPATVEADEFCVHAKGLPLAGGDFSSFADHRIAMSIAVGATRASSPVEIDDTRCAAKSYPTFFSDFN